jgi:Rad3-related DNA helicase
MITQLENPYGLPHPDLRPHQAETIEQLLALRGGTAVINAPTGSGKTSFAAGVASREHVIALVKTKNLQSANYGGSYDFDVLFGRSNYDCVHPDAPSYASAAECMYTGAMNDCEYAGQCPYLEAKRTASFSDRASLNYSYWLAAGWPTEELAESGGYLFCDEAHQLSDVVLDHTSVTVTMGERLEWDLPAFPIVRGRAAAADIETCVGWLSAAERRLRAAAKELAPQGDRGDEEERGEDEPKAEPPSEMVLRKLRKCRNLLAKVAAVREALSTNASDWFLRCGPGARDTVTGREPAFIARPLTARYHFPRYFLSSAWRTVMMSATIGDR